MNRVSDFFLYVLVFISWNLEKNVEKKLPVFLNEIKTKA